VDGLEVTMGQLSVVKLVFCIVATGKRFHDLCLTVDLSVCVVHPLEMFGNKCIDLLISLHCSL
jgi:hypothetical protein